MRTLKLLFLFLISAGPCFAQIGGGQTNVGGGTLVQTFAGVPSGTCGPAALAVNTTNGNLYTCLAGVWTLVAGGGGGSGTVTSVGFTGGLISVATATTTPALTVAGTSGGVPYFSSASTWASSAALTANLPVIGGGAGVAPTVGTVSGNTTKFATFTGAATAARCIDTDANGNLQITAADCGSGSGSGTVSSGTVNTIAKYTGTTTVGNSLLDDGGTTASTLTYTGTGGISSTPSGGVGGTMTLPEGTAPAGAAGKDVLYADSTSHCVELSLNNGSFNCIATAASSLSIFQGLLQAAQEPAHTGDVTNSSGSLGLTIAQGAVTDDKASLLVKPSVGLVATSNLTLSGAQTIDGVLGTAGTTLVLATAQSTASQNGPWVMQSGAWTRPTWYPTGGTTQALQFSTTLARLGTSFSGTVWRMTTAGAITIDTTSTAWVETPLALNATSVAGTLPVGNGGTGLASGTSGGIPYYSGTTTIASSAALTANLPVIGGGAGVAPSVGTVTGNTTKFATFTGSTTAARCIDTDASGNLQVTGADCGTGGSGNAAVASTSAVTSSNPTINTDQQLMELTLSAGYLNIAHQPFLIHGAGTYSSTTASSPALTFKIKLCTVSGCGSGTVVTLANIVSATLNTTALTNATWSLGTTAVTNTTGATGNLVVKGVPGLILDLGAAVSAADSVFADSNTATSSNIDLTAALFVDFTVAQSVVGASNSYTQMVGMLGPVAGSGPAGATGPAGPIGDPGNNGIITRTALNTVRADPPGITWYSAGGGTAQAQTATLPVAPTLTAGLEVHWLPTAANTAAAPTLAVNGLTATNITKCGTAALVANDLTTTQIALVLYDGTEFILQNPQAATCQAQFVSSYSTNAAVTPSGTQFLPLMGYSGGGTSTEVNAQQVMPRAGVVTGLYVSLSANEGAAATLAVTLRKAGVDQAITCTVGNSVSTCNDTAAGHAFAFAAGDLIATKTLQSGTGTSQVVRVSVTYY